MTVRSEGLDDRTPAGRRPGRRLPPRIDDIPGLNDLAPGADPGTNAALDDWFGPNGADDFPGAQAAQAAPAPPWEEQPWEEQRWEEPAADHAWSTDAWDDESPHAWPEDDWEDDHHADEWVEAPAARWHDRDDVRAGPHSSSARPDAGTPEQRWPLEYAEEPWADAEPWHDAEELAPNGPTTSADSTSTGAPYADVTYVDAPAAEDPYAAERWDHESYAESEELDGPDVDGAYADELYADAHYVEAPFAGGPYEPVDDDLALDEAEEQPGRQRWVSLVAPVALIMAIVIVVVLLTGDGDGQEISTPDTTPEELAIQTGTSITLPRAVTSDEPGAATSTTTAAGVLEARELAFVDTDPNTFWVDPAGGDESNDGQTPDTPWSSLQGALDRVQPGQTVFLMTGEYTDLHERQAHYVVERGGTADAWVTIAAGLGQEPVIVATVGNGIAVRADYVEVSGIEIRGQGFSADNPYGWGVLVRDVHHVRIADNTVSGMPVGGIGSVEASNLAFVDNEVFDNSFWGTEQGSGISIWHARDHGTEADENGYHNVISGNVVYRNENKVASRFRNNGAITDGNGVIIDQTDETGFTGRTLVANNVIFDNGGRAVLVLESSRVDVFHNTTYSNGRTGALEGGPVELAAGRANDVRFLNNLAWARPGAPALLYNTSNGIVTGGNLLVSTNQDAYAGERDRVVTDNPGLVAPGIDPAAVDFHPTAGSAATQLGVALDRSLPVDIDGVTRPAPGAVGAYEPPTGQAAPGN